MVISGSKSQYSATLPISLTIIFSIPQVEYDFTYYKMEMAADVQLLILSEGKSNILPADLVLPFRPSSVESGFSVDSEMLKAWRWYLANMKSLPHAIDPHMQKVRIKSYTVDTISFYFISTHLLFNQAF